MLSNQNDNNVEQYDLVVSGMGPIGLASAYFAAKNGKKVLLLEKRKEEDAALRPQIVVLNSDSKNALLSMISESEPLNDHDIKVLNLLYYASGIKVKDVQEFILNRIKALNDKNRISDKPPITLKYQTSLEEVDLEKGECVIKTNDESQSKSKVSFTDLIGADGAKGESLTLVNEGLKKNKSKNKGIKKETPLLMDYMSDTYHLGAYVQIRRKDGNEIDIPEDEFVLSHLPSENRSGKSNLYFLRLNKERYERDERKQIRIGYVGGVGGRIKENKLKIEKINRELANEKEKLKNKNVAEEDPIKKRIANLQSQIDALEIEMKQDSLSHIKKSFVDYLNNVSKKEIKEDDIEITLTSKNPKTEKLKFLTFRGESKKADKAVIQENNHRYYLAGDLYFTPNYEVGHGLNDGLMSAKMFGDPDFDNDKKNHMKKYNNLANKNANSAIHNSQIYRLLGISFLTNLRSRYRAFVTEATNIESTLARKTVSPSFQDVFKSRILKIIDDEFHVDKMEDVSPDTLEKWEKFLKRNKNNLMYNPYQANILVKLIQIKTQFESSYRVDEKIKSRFMHLYDNAKADYIDIINQHKNNDTYMDHEINTWVNIFRKKQYFANTQQKLEGMYILSQLKAAIEPMQNDLLNDLYDKYTNTYLNYGNNSDQYDEQFTEAINKNNFKLVELLIKSVEGEDKNNLLNPPYKNMTPLLGALDNRCSLEIFELLLQNGADPNLSHLHQTIIASALFSAIPARDSQQVDLLLQKIDLLIAYKGDFLLATQQDDFITRSVNNLKVAKYLLKNGLDLFSLQDPSITMQVGDQVFPYSPLLKILQPNLLLRSRLGLDLLLDYTEQKGALYDGIHSGASKLPIDAINALIAILSSHTPPENLIINDRELLKRLTDKLGAKHSDSSAPLSNQEILAFATETLQKIQLDLQKQAKAKIHATSLTSHSIFKQMVTESKSDASKDKDELVTRHIEPKND